MKRLKDSKLGGKFLWAMAGLWLFLWLIEIVLFSCTGIYGVNDFAAHDNMCSILFYVGVLLIGLVVYCFVTIKRRTIPELVAVLVSPVCMLATGICRLGWGQHASWIVSYNGFRYVYNCSPQPYIEGTQATLNKVDYILVVPIIAILMLVIALVVAVSIVVYCKRHSYTCVATEPLPKVKPTSQVRFGGKMFLATLVFVWATLFVEAMFVGYLGMASSSYRVILMCIAFVYYIVFCVMAALRHKFTRADFVGTIATLLMLMVDILMYHGQRISNLQYCVFFSYAIGENYIKLEPTIWFSIGYTIAFVLVQLRRNKQKKANSISVDEETSAVVTSN